MPSEGISCMVKCLIASADKAASLDNVMSIVESGGCEVFVKGMDLETFKGINGVDRMLPDIAHDIEEPLGFEHVDRIWR